MALWALSLIVLLGVIVILAREWLPIGVVGIALPFLLIALGLSDTSTAMGYFISEAIVLIPCVYILGDALFEVGIADRLGGEIKKLSERTKGGGEPMVLLLIILASGAACFVLPRYGVTGALMPVVVAIARSTKISRTKLLLALALAANIWGNNTLMSTPPNMLANGVLEDIGAMTFGFFEYALIGVPIAISGTLVLVLLGKKILPENIDENKAFDGSPDENGGGAQTAVPGWKVVATCVIFSIFILGIMFEDSIGIKGHITGMFCVAALIVCRIVTEKHAYSAVGWGTTFFCAGIQVLGKAVETSGAGEMIASVTLQVLGTTPNPFLITGVMFCAGAVMTQFMSNTGAAGILFPIGISIASSIGADPRAVIMAVVMGCGSSFMTPMATPSNAMVMEKGGILFRDFVRSGIPLMIATAAVCIIGIPLIWPFFD